MLLLVDTSYVSHMYVHMYVCMLCINVLMSIMYAHMYVCMHLYYICVHGTLVCAYIICVFNYVHKLSIQLHRVLYTYVYISCQKPHFFGESMLFMPLLCVWSCYEDFRINPRTINTVNDLLSAAL